MISDKSSFRYYVHSYYRALYPVVADFEAIRTHLKKPAAAPNESKSQAGS